MISVRLCVLIAAVSLQVAAVPPQGPPGPPPFLGHPDRESANECRNEVGLTSAEQETRQDGEMSEKELCFIKCLGTKTGSLNKDGTLNMENIKNNLPDHMEEDHQSVLSCLKKVGAVTTCQHVKKVVKCFPDPKERERA